MIQINNKIYRNLQEQVYENMKDIENFEGTSLKSTDIAAGKVLKADGDGGVEWGDAGAGANAVEAPSALASGSVVIGTTGGDRNVATLASGTLGYVLTQGVGAPTWAAPSVEGTGVKSTGVTSGYVLTADGDGTSSWAAGQAAVEGADVLSTGISSGYVLGADGDGTSSWKLAATGDVSALSTLGVGSVVVGVGSKTVNTISGTNGQILYWNGGAAFTDPGIEYEVLV